MIDYGSTMKTGRDKYYMNIKPPVGLKPKWMVYQERFQEVCEAISRRWQIGQKIPIEWMEEYNELLEKIK